MTSFLKPLSSIAVCLVVLLGLAFAPQASALTTGGTLAASEDSDGDGLPTTDLLSGSHNFNAIFAPGDAAGDFLFNFHNSSSSAVLLTVVNATVGQSDSLYFTDGVTTTFGILDRDTAEKIDDAFSLAALVNAGASIALKFVYGLAVGDTGTGAGPDIDFRIEATSVVPLPAGLLLFLTGLAGVGFLGRYKARRGEPA